MPQLAYSPVPEPGGPPWPARDTLPTMYDLPSEDPEEPGLPDQFHEFQPQLLRQTFIPPHHDRSELFVAADMNLYYDVRHPLHHKRPDWFAVVSTSALYPNGDLRLSYVMWQEQVIPYLVVELLSPGTEKEDLGQTGPRPAGQPPTKWEVYERILKIPYYLVYSRYDNHMRAFVHDGARYREQALPSQRLWLAQIDIGIGVWHGEFADCERDWLRFYDAKGNWIETPQEQQQARAEHQQARAEHQQARAERQQARADELQCQVRQVERERDAQEARFRQEQERAEQARQTALRFREKLQALGIDPDAV